MGECAEAGPYAETVCRTQELEYWTGVAVDPKRRLVYGIGLALQPPLRTRRLMLRRFVYVHSLSPSADQVAARLLSTNNHLAAFPPGILLLCAAYAGYMPETSLCVRLWVDGVEDWEDLGNRWDGFADATVDDVSGDLFAVAGQVVVRLAAKDMVEAISAGTANISAATRTIGVGRARSTALRLVVPAIAAIGNGKLWMDAPRRAAPALLARKLELYSIACATRWAPPAAAQESKSKGARPPIAIASAWPGEAAHFAISRMMDFPPDAAAPLERSSVALCNTCGSLCCWAESTARPRGALVHLSPTADRINTWSEPHVEEGNPTTLDEPHGCARLVYCDGQRVVLWDRTIHADWPLSAVGAGGASWLRIITLKTDCLGAQNPFYSASLSKRPRNLVLQKEGVVAVAVSDGWIFWAEARCDRLFAIPYM